MLQIYLKSYIDSQGQTTCYERQFSNPIRFTKIKTSFHKFLYFFLSDDVDDGQTCLFLYFYIHPRNII